MPGGRVYGTVSPPQEQTAGSRRAGWATYLTVGGSGNNYTRGRESPVYALAASACGEHVYAGTEGTMWELDFMGRSIAGRGSTYSPKPLAMYEFTGKMRVWQQSLAVEMGKSGEMGGRLDARWMPVETMRRRW